MDYLQGGSNDQSDDDADESGPSLIVQFSGWFLVIYMNVTKLAPTHDNTEEGTGFYLYTHMQFLTFLVKSKLNTNLL